MNQRKLSENYHPVENASAKGILHPITLGGIKSITALEFVITVAN